MRLYDGLQPQFHKIYSLIAKIYVLCIRYDVKWLYRYYIEMGRKQRVGRFVYINVILSVGYFSFWSRTEDYISAGDK